MTSEEIRIAKATSRSTGASAIKNGTIRAVVPLETLFGCESNNCAAYCKLHKKCMTVKQIRQRNCLQKQCWHLERNEEHNWWHQRAATKQKRIARKERLSGGIANV